MIRIRSSNSGSMEEGVNQLHEKVTSRNQARVRASRLRGGLFKRRGREGCRSRAGEQEPLAVDGGVVVRPSWLGRQFWPGKGMRHGSGSLTCVKRSQASLVVCGSVDVE